MTTLDKIRDEIEESITDYILDEEDTNMAIRMGNVMTKVFDIIDNYAEQEPKIPCDLCRYDYLDGVCEDCPAMAKGGNE